MTITRNEVIQLLQIAGAYDNRKAAEAPIHAWFDSATRARWTYLEAADAIKDHYATSTAFVMPGHITALIQTRRRDKALRQAAPALPAAVRATDTQPRQWAKPGGTARQRRAALLAHPHIAAKLCDPPLRLARPEQWNGYIPPATMPDGEPNTSPIREQLVALVAEIQAAGSSATAAPGPATGKVAA